MSDKITLQVVGENNQTKPFTVLAEKASYINSIIAVGENGEITEADKATLQEFAGRNGDLGVIEECDMNLQDKINYANYCGYDKFYDIKIADDKECIEVTIKKTAALNFDPNLANIKEDFLGGKSDILVKQGYIPYGNEKLISEKTGGGNYDEVTLRPGETIRIPISELKFSESPRSWWARLIN